MTSTRLKEQHKRSLKESAYLRIAAWLVDGTLQPGEPLGEGALTERLGIGRTPVREALLQLAQEGLVEIIPRRGAFVAKVSVNDIRELFEIREALEGIAARLAAVRANREDLRQLEKLFQEAEAEPEAAHKRERLEAAGDALHDFILKACDNSRIVQIINTYKVLLQRERKHAAALIGRIEAAAEDHQAVLQALLAADPDRAEASMRRHIANTTKSLLDAYRNNY